MRPTLSVLVVSSLLLFGCGGDSTESTATVPSTDAAAAPTDAAADAAATTAAAAGTTVAPPGALIPMALCLGSHSEVYFGYDNESTEPVIVAEGDANHLDGAATDDNPLLTTLFAPGVVDVAFWAFPASTADVVWTLTGPDGVEREASGGSTTEPCPSDFLGAGTARNPTLEIVGYTLAADGESVEVELRLTGLDETSVCNEALEAQPALVSIGDGSTFPTAFEPDVTVTVGPFGEADSGGARLATASVYALIVDQCAAAGATGASWWPPPELSLLPFGTRVCANLVDGDGLSVELTEGLCGLGGTGGSSIRPR